MFCLFLMHHCTNQTSKNLPSGKSQALIKKKKWRKCIYKFLQLNAAANCQQLVGTEAECWHFLSHTDCNNPDQDTHTHTHFTSLQPHMRRNYISRSRITLGFIQSSKSGECYRRPRGALCRSRILTKETLFIPICDVQASPNKKPNLNLPFFFLSDFAIYSPCKVVVNEMFDLLDNYKGNDVKYQKSAFVKQMRSWLLQNRS